MIDDYVDAARAAHAAASYNLSEYPGMSREQEVAVWKQAFLEQQILADSNQRALITTAAVCLFSNVLWAFVTWWPR